MASADYLMRYIALIEAIVDNATGYGSLPNVPMVLDEWVDRQQSSGAFLSPDVKANPESRWFDEMRILHALADRAVKEKSPVIDQAVRKAAEYHLREIQPDHATADPWGLLAYIQYAPPLADQVLHAVRMQYPQGVHGTPLLLLTDVLYGLRRLIEDQGND